MSVDDLPTVFVSEWLFSRLLDYSLTLPTETTVGKWWRAERPRGSGRWILCAYGPHEDSSKVSIIRRRLDWLPWLDRFEVVGGHTLPAMDREATL